jgi:hypothetical protein
MLREGQEEAQEKAWEAREAEEAQGQQRGWKCVQDDGGDGSAQKAQEGWCRQGRWQHRRRWRWRWR